MKRQGAKRKRSSEKGNKRERFFLPLSLDDMEHETRPGGVEEEEAGRVEEQWKAYAKKRKKIQRKQS